MASNDSEPSNDSTDRPTEAETETTPTASVGRLFEATLRVYDGRVVADAPLVPRWVYETAYDRYDIDDLGDGAEVVDVVIDGASRSIASADWRPTELEEIRKPVMTDGGQDVDRYAADDADEGWKSVHRSCTECGAVVVLDQLVPAAKGTYKCSQCGAITKLDSATWEDRAEWLEQHSNLQHRRSQVQALTELGYDAEECSDELGISPHTVHTTRSAIRNVIDNAVTTSMLQRP